MLFRRRKRKIKRIMIVEDEPLVAFDNEMLLADAGYDVAGTLDNYGDAIALLDHERVDLILCDITLAGKRSGLDLAREAAARSVPVLFVTGHPPEQTDLAIGVLKKPYNERTLKAALDSVDRHLCGEEHEDVPGLSFYGGHVRNR